MYIFGEAEIMEGSRKLWTYWTQLDVLDAIGRNWTYWTYWTQQAICLKGLFWQ